MDIEESKLLSTEGKPCLAGNAGGGGGGAVDGNERFSLMSCGTSVLAKATRTSPKLRGKGEDDRHLTAADSCEDCSSIACITTDFRKDSSDCSCAQEQHLGVSRGQTARTKHLYPNVVVNASIEHSDIDSDEEDFNLRKNNNNTKNNDSGQGSSIETTSTHSTSTPLSTPPSQLNTTQKEPVEENRQNDNKGGGILDKFPDIDLSHDKFNLAGTSFGATRGSPIVSGSRRGSPSMGGEGEGGVIGEKIAAAQFTEIPLDNGGGRRRSSSGASSSGKCSLNTYAPRKVDVTTTKTKGEIMIPKPESIWKQELIRKSKTMFLNSANQKSWTIFGKVAIPVSKNSSAAGEKSNSPSPKKKHNFSASTTALIFENRPSGLPQKSAKEEQKQREQYEEIIEQVRKKEMKEKENETKKMKEAKKLEDKLSNTLKVWKQEVLPDWESCKNTKKVRELWWQGLPPSVRGEVWMVAIGNQLNMTSELFDIFLTDAKERMKNVTSYNPMSSLPNCESSLVVSKENTVGLIALDVSRTFPSLCIFQKGGPYNEPLKHLLAAYTCHRPDVGYVQGMSFLAAVLLLNMDLCDAFICFSNLLNQPCQMAFFMVDQPMMDAYYRTFDVLLDEQIPRLHLHFKQECLSHDIYLIDWIYTMFTKSLPLDTACRVWDLFCRDGEEFLFRTALGILLMYEDVLLEMEFFRLAQYLTKLSNTITPSVLFSYIEKINIPKHKFQQTLSNFKIIAKSNPPPT